MSNDHVLEPVPWITHDAFAYLQQILPPQASVFEWGAGGSTLYFFQQGCQLVSVEHEPEWVTALLKKEPQLAESLLLIQPDSDGGYSRYARKILDFAPHSFDLVMVDGRWRHTSTYLAMPQVKAGGWLVLDNSEREYYSYAIRALVDDGWTTKHFSGPGPYNDYAWRTSFFQKPTPCPPTSSS